IEVKPIISNFGQTLRQLNTYRHYQARIEREYNQERLNVFLFTPDTRFKEAFESQGIKVISP
ncbi:MAG: hypothetical protein MUO73_09415, partial [Thermoplasmata archaeon]|nr:hypothetical protein [Thermoplasmata archaeon]